jgi:hypothetical protein
MPCDTGHGLQTLGYGGLGIKNLQLQGLASGGASMQLMSVQSTLKSYLSWISLAIKCNNVLYM